MKKVIAWFPMHACYHVGDWASQLLNRWPDCKDGSLMDRLGSVVYRVYNRLMCWSVDLNDWAGFKLWHKEGEPDDITGER